MKCNADSSASDCTLKPFPTEEKPVARSAQFLAYMAVNTTKDGKAALEVYVGTASMHTLMR